MARREQVHMVLRIGVLTKAERFLGFQKNVFCFYIGVDDAAFNASISCLMISMRVNGPLSPPSSPKVVRY